MCTMFLATITRKNKVIKSIELPDKTMPLCGCWLFDLDFEGEVWAKIKASHEEKGNVDKFEQTKGEAIILNNMVRDKIFGLMAELEYDQKIIIEKLI